MSFFTTYSFSDGFWLSVCPDCFSKINAKVIAVAHQVPELPVMPLGPRALASVTGPPEQMPALASMCQCDGTRSVAFRPVKSQPWVDGSYLLVSWCASLTPVLSVWPVVWGVLINNALRYHWTILYQRIFVNTLV